MQLLWLYPLVEVIDVASRDKKGYLLASNPPDSVFDLEDFKDDKVVRYHRDMYVTGEYIYILTTNEVTSSGRQKIKVIDWDGNVENHYEVPAEYELSSIVIDEQGQKIYGTSYVNDIAYIFEY